MGMQVASSLAVGSGLVATPLDVQREKRTPFPMNQNADAVENEAALPDSRKLKTVDLEKTTSDLEQINHAFNRRLKFVIDQESRQVTIKVIDNETDKVIKVLPPEELQRLHSRLRETMGFLFDRMV